MKQFLTILALVLIVLAMPSPAQAEDCRYMNFRIPQGTGAPIDPLPGYNECWSGSKLLGTLKGSWVGCLDWSNIKASDQVWNDGSYDYWLLQFDTVITTADGELNLTERLVFQGFDLAHGLAEVTGGTGDYEDATGVFGMGPKWPNRLDVVTYQGDLCTP